MILASSNGFCIGDNDGETYVTLQEEEYTIPKSNHEDEEDESQGKNQDVSSLQPS